MVLMPEHVLETMHEVAASAASLTEEEDNVDHAGEHGGSSSQGGEDGCGKGKGKEKGKGKATMQSDPGRSGAVPQKCFIHNLDLLIL